MLAHDDAVSAWHFLDTVPAILPVQDVAVLEMLKEGGVNCLKARQGGRSVTQVQEHPWLNPSWALLLLLEGATKDYTSLHYLECERHYWEGSWA